MSNDNNRKSLFDRIFGTHGQSKQKQPSGGFVQSSNYGNHVGHNAGTVTQVGGGTIGSSKGAMILGEVRTLTVNGREFTGRKVEQRDGRIFVDDRDVTNEVGEPAGQGMIVVVQGDVLKVELLGGQRLTVTGNAGSVSSTNGTVEIAGGVAGDVATKTGTIICGKVGGNVTSVHGAIHTH